MSAYPTLSTTLDSVPEPIPSREARRATNGALKLRLLHPTEKLRFNLVHELSASEKSTLESHYSSNKDASFSYTWPGGSSYTVMYTARPTFEEQGGGWFIARVQLEEA